MSNEMVAEEIAMEGLEYAVCHMLDIGAIEDLETQRLCGSVRNSVKALELHLKAELEEFDYDA